MKFFAVFACVVAVAVASPNTWTLNELSEAIESPYTDASLKPVLEHALNIVMDSIWAGETLDSILIQTQPGVAGSYNLAELDYFVSHSTYYMKPYLEAAMNQMMENLWSGQQVDTVSVELPALEISYWSLAELDSALSSADTSADLVPYLEEALNELMSALFAGYNEAAIVVATPVQTAVAVSPITAPAVAPAPAVVPAPAVDAPTSSSSALVQIILNVASN